MAFKVNHHNDWLLLDSLMDTMPKKDFFALTRPYHERIIEIGPHKECMACYPTIDSRAKYGRKGKETCSNHPIHE